MRNKVPQTESIKKRGMVLSETDREAVIFGLRQKLINANKGYEYKQYLFKATPAINKTNVAISIIIRASVTF